MKKRGKKILIAALVAVVLILVLSFAGCAKSGLNGSEAIATLDEGTQVPLGEFSLLLRYQQAQMEAYYGAMVGGNMYQQDMTGDGTLYGDSVKTNLMDEFKRMYILEAEASAYGVELTEEEKTAATEAAKKFLADNTDAAKKAVGADQQAVEHLLMLMTLNEKMYDALTVDVDTQVSDAEAAQKRIDYVYVSTMGTEQDADGNVIDLTEEEKAQKKAQLAKVLDAAKASGDLNAAAEAEGLTASTTTYGDNSTSPAEEVRKAADALKEGEFAEIVEGTNGYYVVRLASTLDREATDNRKESIVQERRDNLFEEKYQELESAHTFTPAEDVMAKLTFERIYTLKTEEQQ